MNKKFFAIFLVSIIGISILARLVPHAPNFTPIAALALFMGVYAAKISKWYLAVPLAVMLVSDAFLGFYEPKIMAVVYVSFFAIGLVGLLLKMCETRFRVSRVYTGAFGVLAGSLLFFFTTNFAVWAFSGMYALTLEGLMLSYYMALPFLKFSLLGDLFYVSLFFGIYELATSLSYKHYGQQTTTATANSN